MSACILRHKGSCVWARVRTHDIHLLRWLVQPLELPGCHLCCIWLWVCLSFCEVCTGQWNNVSCQSARSESSRHLCQKQQPSIHTLDNQPLATGEECIWCYSCIVKPAYWKDAANCYSFTPARLSHGTPNRLDAWSEHCIITKPSQVKVVRRLPPPKKVEGSNPCEWSIKGTFYVHPSCSLGRSDDIDSPSGGPGE